MQVFFTMIFWVWALKCSKLGKTTLETSGEDVKTHSKWVGKIWKHSKWVEKIWKHSKWAEKMWQNTLEMRGEDVKLHSKRVGNWCRFVDPTDLFKSNTPTYEMAPHENFDKFNEGKGVGPYPFGVDPRSTFTLVSSVFFHLPHSFRVSFSAGTAPQTSCYLLTV